MPAYTPTTWVDDATELSADNLNNIEQGIVDSVDGINGYVHTEGSPAATWAVTHTLGKYPSVMVVDSAGQVVIGDVRYVDQNEVELTFASAFAGKAYLT